MKRRVCICGAWVRGGEGWFERAIRHEQKHHGGEAVFWEARE